MAAPANSPPPIPAPPMSAPVFKTLNPTFPVEVIAQPSSNYEEWRSSRFPAAEAADASIPDVDADPDRDGMSNLVEFCTQWCEAIIASPSSPVDQAGGAPTVFPSRSRPAM